MDLETIESSAAAIADSRNDEPILGVARRIARGVGNDVIARELQQTCAFAATFRKLRKKIQGLTHFRARVADTWASAWGPFSSGQRRVSFYEGKIGAYELRLQGLSPCLRCSSCVQHGFAAHSLAAEPMDVASLLQCIARTPRAGTAVAAFIRRTVAERSAELREAFVALIQGE